MREILDPRRDITYLAHIGGETVWVSRFAEATQEEVAPALNSAAIVGSATDTMVASSKEVVMAVAHPKKTCETLRF